MSSRKYWVALTNDQTQCWHADCVTVTEHGVLLLTSKGDDGDFIVLCAAPDEWETVKCDRPSEWGSE